MTDLRAALDILIWQQRNPVAFLQSLYANPHKLWRHAWIVRGIAIGAAAVGLGCVALIGKRPWDTLLLSALLSLIIVQMLCGVVVMITGYPQFWLLYTYSPIILIFAFICGLAPLSIFWNRLAGSVIVPFAVSFLLVDAFTIWVHKYYAEGQQESQRWRTGGLISDRRLTLWRRIRLIRLLTAPGVAIGIYIYVQNALFALTFLIGYWRMGTTLAAWIFKLPIVRCKQKRWQATYIGRTAILIPRQSIRVIFTSEYPIPDQSIIVLTLFREGYLGPAIRRECAMLSPTHLHDLLFELSRRKDGDAAIRYIIPALPLSLQPVGILYAALAYEAAKPFDLQRWINTLGHLPPVSTAALDAATITTLQSLEFIREALLGFVYDPHIAEHAMQYLRRLTAGPAIDRIFQGDLCTDTSLDVGLHAWTFALLLHLERHNQHLLSAQDT